MKIKSRYYFLIFCAVILCVPILFREQFSYMIRLWFEIPKREVNKFFIHNHSIILFPICLGKIIKDSICYIESKNYISPFIILIISLVLIIIGSLSSIYYVSNIGIILSILTCIIYFYGYDGILKNKILVFLIFFLVPLPQYILIQIYSKISIISSLISEKILLFLGWSVYFDGNIVDLGLAKISSIDINNFLSVMFFFIGFIIFLSHFINRNFVVRIVFLLSNLILFFCAVVFKSILFVYYVKIGSELNKILSSSVNYIILTVLCLFSFLYFYFIKNSSNISFSASRYFSFENSFNKFRFIRLNLIIYLSLIVLSSIYLKNHNQNYIPEREMFVNFPVIIKNYHGKESYVDKNDLASLHLDDYLSRIYTIDNQSSIEIWVAYYGSQKPGASIHSPKACLRGGGWEMIDGGDVFIESEKFNFKRFIIKIGDQKQLVYYTYIVGNKIVTNEYLVKFYLIFNKLLFNRSDGALIRIVTPLLKGEEISNADERIKQFLTSLLAVLRPYISSKEG
ncbi:EpsI family protein [Desulfomicrobium norvegicum]|uniref:EpsI family protein n=1 Tax=Desulfomicrobium norvegicum (strain DSM 1741 / NCIMB 8310) TaxID=52561 RepID=A0A8G2F7J5_DESNO|nr:exosortase C-terminal domain/associated protein EpsI [Desulfomicrobium norvegicum]SFL76204.1 EpsI family protein [Desulfomicrobium norvegicum]